MRISQGAVGSVTLENWGSDDADSLVTDDAIKIENFRSNTAAYRGKDRTTFDELAFMAGARYSPTAGNKARIYVNNPSASGVAMLVDKLLITTESTSRVVLEDATTEKGASIGNGQNSYLGKTAGQGELTYESVASAGGTSYGELYVVAGTPFVMELPHPILIGANRALGITMVSSDEPINVMAWWREF